MVAHKDYRLARIAGFSFLLLSLGLVAWYVFRPNPLRRAASEMVEALQVGDGASLMRAASSEEIGCSSLDEDKLRKAWEILIEPHIKSSKYVRTESAKQTSNDFQATASTWYVDRVGNPWRLVMIANQAEGGPRTTVLFHMLGTASLFDDEGRALPGQTNETLLRGVRKYRSQLEAIGIPKVMLNLDLCLRWDELISMLEKKVVAQTN